MERSNDIWGQHHTVTRAGSHAPAGESVSPQALPDDPHLMAKRPEGPDSGIEARRTTVRALVIENAAQTAPLLAKLGASSGLLVDALRDPRAALERLRDQFYDVIVADLPLTQMEPEDFFRDIVAISLEQAGRIVFLASDLGDPLIRKFLTGAGRPFLTQPVQGGQLHDLVLRVGRGRPKA